VVARVTTELTAAPIPALTQESLLVAPCSAVTSSETLSKFPAALAAWDVPALTRRSVLAAPPGVVALITMVARFLAALADWYVLALTRGSVLHLVLRLQFHGLRQQILTRS
jgi:hypothetical protein